MILKNGIEYYLECIKNKQMKISSASKLLHCSRQWLSVLYKRYTNNQPLEQKKGHKKCKLTKDHTNFASKLFKDLSYTDNNITYVPSMEILKAILLENYEDFPNISIQTLRNYLKKHKFYPKNIKSRKYRKRFEASNVGEIIQGDVSTHRWIPEMDLKFHLILFIDDKSRYVLYAKFIDSDNLDSHITALKDIFKTFGFPMSIYYDNDSKYSYIRHGGIHYDYVKEKPDLVIPNALYELGIKLINSKPYQPQGKGKVERKFLTFQKQITFYLKYKKAKNIDEANKVLEEYIEKHNKTYSRAINCAPEDVFKESVDVFRDINKYDIENIENCLTKRQTRKVSKVNEISYSGIIYNVPKYKKYSLANFEIEVRENPNQWIKLFYKGEFLIKYNLGEVKTWLKKYLRM